MRSCAYVCSYVFFRFYLLRLPKLLQVIQCSFVFLDFALDVLQREQRTPIHRRSVDMLLDKDLVKYQWSSFLLVSDWADVRRTRVFAVLYDTAMRFGG